MGGGGGGGGGKSVTTTIAHLFHAEVLTLRTQCLVVSTSECLLIYIGHRAWPINCNV